MNLLGIIINAYMNRIGIFQKHSNFFASSWVRRKGLLSTLYRNKNDIHIINKNVLLNSSVWPCITCLLFVCLERSKLTSSNFRLVSFSSYMYYKYMWNFIKLVYHCHHHCAVSLFQQNMHNIIIIDSPGYYLSSFNLTTYYSICIQIKIPKYLTWVRMLLQVGPRFNQNRA